MTIIPEDVNVNDNEGGGSTPVDAYTKMEVDTLLAKKFELTGNNTISGENSFYATQNFNTQVGLFGLMRVMDGGVLRATTGKILIDNAPTEDTQAANKKYVDDTVAANGGASQEDVDEIKETVDAIPSTYLNKKTGGDISGASRFNGHVDFNNTVSHFKNVTLGSEVTFRNTGTTILGTTTITVEPTADNMPATKKYVDNQVTQVETAIATNATNITTLRNDVDGLGDQVSDIQAIVNTLSSKDRWILNGKPENLTLTTSLQKVVMPATTRFPTTQPASMEMTEDGTGILFKKAGLVHFRRRVSLGGANTENLFYEMRVNDTQLEPLQTQAVSVSKNTMSYTIDFYWQVTAQQTLSIWANCLENTCALNYKGVITIIEYI